jgi:SPP1 gp7 family putative phage head morphogenesis protein
LGPLVEGLERSLLEAVWAGYSGEALDYSAAVAAARKNPLFGVNLKNVLAWGRREAMAEAAADMETVEAAVRGLVEDAIKKGETLETFQTRLSEMLEARGLAGPVPWHAETIFRTNVLSAYAGGEWAGAKALQSAGQIVAARYVAVIDDRTRETHLAMDSFWAGLDDPIWDTWWPPNGWNCRCQIRLLSQADVDALGGWEAAPQAPAVYPDPGFDGNPGKALWRIVGTAMTA